MRTTRLYIIPGAGESTRAKNYRELIKHARKQGLKVVPVTINWSTKMDMTDYIAQANKKIPPNIVKDYILGFSLGAYIAAILSKNKKAKGYVFCSLSPYFKENLKNIPNESKKFWGPKMMKSFKKYSFPIKQFERAWFLIGKKDWSVAIKANEAFYNKWLGKKNLYLINDAGHELGHSNYVKRVKSIIKKL